MKFSKRISVLLVVDLLYGIAVMFSPTAILNHSMNPSFLAPESSLKYFSTSEWKNPWEIYTQNTNFYSPGELAARTRAIRKAVPLVKQTLLRRCQIQASSITGIFATGDYILNPSWGKPELLCPPEALDFIVFTTKSIKINGKRKKLHRIEGIEIYPETIFDPTDLGYKSAYHMNILVCHVSKAHLLDGAAAYYLGCLIDGKIPWGKKPDAEVLHTLISQLISKAVETGVANYIFYARWMGVASILLKTLPETLAQQLPITGGFDAQILNELARLCAFTPDAPLDLPKEPLETSL